MFVALGLHHIPRHPCTCRVGRSFEDCIYWMSSPRNPQGGPSRDAQVADKAVHHENLRHPVCPARRAGGKDRLPVRS